MKMTNLKWAFNTTEQSLQINTIEPTPLSFNLDYTKIRKALSDFSFLVLSESLTAEHTIEQLEPKTCALLQAIWIYLTNKKGGTTVQKLYQFIS